jgi:rare lipoprotein A
VAAIVFGFDSGSDRHAMRYRARRRRLVICALALFASAGCYRQRRADVPNYRDPSFIGEGWASYYGAGLQGHSTASGERFNKNSLTAAHRTLSFGTCVRVVNIKNERSVVVRVNDRGPFAHDRVIDVSEAAARKLEMIGQGVTRVRLYHCGNGEH